MRNVLAVIWVNAIVLLPSCVLACGKTKMIPHVMQTKWTRHVENPIFRDSISGANYQVASDGHVFYDDQNELSMIYSGDHKGNSSIKLVRGSNWTDWFIIRPLLFEVGPSGLDRHKETAFYRKATNGKHQIYYIGYDDEDTYTAQIYLAESDALDGTYIQQSQPIVSRGHIAGKSVYCMTSPSVVEHAGLLYLVFIGWDASPSEVSEVWLIGATSIDDGYTWTDFQIVGTPIGMEGQLTKRSDSSFIAVRTGEYSGSEAIFYATANHPFGPWQNNDTPILIQDNTPYEKDEIIAPQITIDPSTGKEYLYYTGADYQTGWWMMMAKMDR